MLGAYYRIAGDERGREVAAATAADTDLDRQGFDAKRYFDGMVSSGQLDDLVHRSHSLDHEVKDLDANMQTLVYENYSKFIRATDVIRMMKGSIDGLAPDIRSLESHLGRITEHQQRVEDGVAGRAGQIETLLTRQRVCKKLKVLFDLPQTLQRCLDRGAYGKAVEAYCCCSTFLRQYREMPTFQKVLAEVDQQMARIRTALEERLRSAELPVDEAVNSALTLLDLGEDRAEVLKEYLSGRTAVLQTSLERCFTIDDELAAANPPAAQATTESQEGTSEPTSGAAPSQELSPDSLALQRACARATDLYIPQLCDAVEGYQKLQARGTATQPAPVGSGAGAAEELLSDFVSARVQDLCDRISRLMEERCSPTRVLVSCIHAVRDALRRLHSLQPKLLTRIFMGFLSRISTDAMRSLFATGASSMVGHLRRLHGECQRLQEAKSAGLDEVLEEIVKTEQNMIMHCFTALTDCQPLLNLLGSDRAACQQLVRALHSQLVAFFLVFADASYAYVSHKATPLQPSSEFSSPAAAGGQHRPVAQELEDMASLEWNGLFALALVRIGRHLEMKAIAKVWSVARDLFANGDPNAPELPAPAAVVKVARGAAQTTITQYVLASGQRLAHFFRNSIQNRNWMTVREPRDPTMVVDTVLKEVHVFDGQLARILMDPRRPRGADQQRRTLRCVQDPMELEMERLLAKKMQVFAIIPFNRNGAMVGILRTAFKALCEYVREETFAKFGLQQIQVDCAFLGDLLRGYVESEDWNQLGALLDEAVTSATQRCVEPVLMEAVIVETLCDKKKQGFKFE